MQCPVCARQVAAWADFCPHCGAAQVVAPRVETPSSPAASERSLTDEVFGFSPPADQLGHDAFAESDVVENEVVEEAPTWEEPMVGGPAGHDEVPADATPREGTSESFAVSGADGFARADVRDDGEPGARVAETSERNDVESDVSPDAPSSSRRLVAIAGVLVGTALLLVLWWTLRIGSDDGGSLAGPAASPSASAPAASGSPSVGAAPSASPSVSASTTPSPSATPSPLPAGAIACGTSDTSGSPDTAAVFTPDANTSCPFAQAVAAAYRTQSPGGGDATITAHSPVTNRDYSLTCTGVLPTTCRADSGATVFLTRG